MLTKQPTEATTATASRDHTLFVTAARWLRNNGWRPDVTTFGTDREMRWRKDADTISVVFAQGVTLRLQGVRGTWLQLDDPADVQRVLDQLVLAHTLPAEFASWAPVPICDWRDFYGTDCHDEAVAGTSRCGYHSHDKCGEPCKHGGSCTLKRDHDGAHTASGLCHWWTSMAVAR